MKRSTSSQFTEKKPEEVPALQASALSDTQRARIVEFPGKKTKRSLQRPSRLEKRRWRRIKALLSTPLSGPLYGLALYRILSPQPLDPEENWKYWTEALGNRFKALLLHFPPEAVKSFARRNLLSKDHASGIEAHYDVSNDFYKLFLDKEFMFYSAADFHAAHESIEDAQRHKAEHICGLIDPLPGQRILDLGCGWGSMLRYIDATSDGKCELSGYTLSKEQHRYVRKELGFQVELRDFVDCALRKDHYDCIYSIGAMEHVRPGELLQLHQKLHAALKPGGRCVHHFFSLNKDRNCSSTMLGQLFFPGSLLSTHEYHLEALKKAGFRVAHDSLHDYRPTLKAWYDRLVENKAAALKLVSLAVYNRYMTFFPASWRYFKEGEASVHRLVCVKKQINGKLPAGRLV